MHKKILTGESLWKRNIVGPHHCVLCKCAKETSDHLFIECEFLKEVWSFFLHGLNVCPPSQVLVVSMFTSLAPSVDCYPEICLLEALALQEWYHFQQYRLVSSNGGCPSKGPALRNFESFPRQRWHFPSNWRKDMAGCLFQKGQNQSKLSPNLKGKMTNLRFRGQLSTLVEIPGQVHNLLRWCFKGNPVNWGAGGVIFSPNGNKEDSFS